MSRNRGFEYREQLGSGADRQDLTTYLARRYPHSSREVWRQRIEEGRVRLDDRVAGVDSPLRPGQWLSWHRPPWEEPDAPAVFAVLYRDDDLLAVAKPAGLPTMPGGGFLDSTLLGCLRRLDPQAAPLHRLGRWTSGLVLCGRTPLGRRELTARWNGGVEKVYRAWATGRPEQERFSIDTPIGPVPYPRLGSLHAASPTGKPALSHVEVVERRPDSFLADVRIETGRAHQIRIHLAAAGHPLVGDPLYGPGGLPLADGGLPGDPGYRLHALRLAFDHPRSGRRLSLRCEPPAALQPTGD